MAVIHILVALIGAVLRITADAFAHLTFLLAGVLIAAAAAVAIAAFTGTSAISLIRRRRNRDR